MANTQPANILLTNPIKLTEEKKIDHDLIDKLLKDVNSISNSHPLNESQEKAFKSTFKQALTLIWGPPGTGKTDTLSKIIHGWLSRKDKTSIKILIGSNNYNAIDNLLRKVLDHKDENNLPNIFRVRSTGREKLPFKEVIDINASYERERKYLYSVLNSEQSLIVASTWKQIINISKKEGNKYQQEWFDLIIIDEASQVPTSSAMAYFILSKIDGHFILAGDPKQLGPIYSYKIEEENYLYDSIFTYYSEKFKIPPTPLDTSYRSNHPITIWPSERFYNNDYFSFNPQKKLSHKVHIVDKRPENWPENLIWHPCLYSLVDPDNVISVLIHDDDISTLSNRFESDVIASLIYMYKNIFDNDNINDFWNQRIGVVTPHRAQVSMIRNKISNSCGIENNDSIAVDSVDKFQGDEREIILSSYAVSDKDFIKAEEEFILNAKRFNVTLTRAKYKFILVISKSLVEHISGDLTIAEDASHLQMFITKYCTNLESFKIDYNDLGNNIELNCSIKIKNIK